MHRLMAGTGVPATSRMAPDFLALEAERLGRMELAARRPAGQRQAVLGALVSLAIRARLGTAQTASATTPLA